jgi:ribosomal protein S18 acetylase RimI-like enzyme
VITFQEEPFGKFFDDAQELFCQHWKELALNQEKIPMDLDRERYETLEKAEMLFVLTVRDDEKIVGYLVAFPMSHPHYKSSGLFALTDMYWVAPEYRHGIGTKLFIEFEQRMRKRGVVQIMTGCKRHQDHTALFEALGWTNSDLTFVKVLI